MSQNIYDNQAFSTVMPNCHALSSVWGSGVEPHKDETIVLEMSLISIYSRRMYAGYY